MEKAAASELENTANVIKYTGLYDKVDRIYGDMEMAKKGGQLEEEDPEGGGGSGGAGGGGGFGGGFDAPDLDLDDESLDTEGEDPFGEADLGGETDLGGSEETADVGVDSEMAEIVRKKGNVIKENRKLMGSRKRKPIKRSNYLNELTNVLEVEEEFVKESVKIYDKSLIINNTINSMINEIDDNLANESSLPKE